MSRVFVVTSIVALALSLGAAGCSPDVVDDESDIHVASPAEAIVIPRAVLDDDSSSGGHVSGQRRDDLVLQLTNRAVYSCKAPIASTGCGQWQLSIELRPSELEPGRFELAVPALEAEVDFTGPYDGFDDCSGGKAWPRHGTLVINEVGETGVRFHLAGTNGGYDGNGDGPGLNVHSDGSYEALRCD